MTNSFAPANAGKKKAQAPGGSTQAHVNGNTHSNRASVVKSAGSNLMAGSSANRPKGK